MWGCRFGFEQNKNEKQLARKHDSFATVCDSKTLRSTVIVDFDSTAFDNLLNHSHCIYPALTRICILPMMGKKGLNHFCTVFMGVDNGVDNGSPPRLLDGHRVFEGGQLGGQ